MTRHLAVATACLTIALAELAGAAWLAVHHAWWTAALTACTAPSFLAIAAGARRAHHRARAEEQHDEPDTCHLVDVDGEAVLVRGAGDFTAQDASFYAEVVSAAKRKHAAEHPTPAAPERSDLHITSWKCPFCVGGIEPSDDGQGRYRCMHCTGTGLTDQPCGPAERAPRPPGVMRAPCADCAFRPGSPELEENGARLPEDEPFFCHQGLPISAFGAYTPTAAFRGLPLGAMVCAGWWALRTGETPPSKPYREVPVTEDQVEERWGRRQQA